MSFDAHKSIERCDGFRSCTIEFSLALLSRRADLKNRSILFADRGRLVVLLFALAMGGNLSSRSEKIGFSVNQFKRTVAGTQIMSFGRAGQLLGFLRFIGFLESAPRDAEGKRLWLRNAEPMLNHMSTTLSICYEAASPLLRPDVRIDRPFESDVAVGRFGKVVFDRVRSGWRPFKDLDAVDTCMGMQGGLSVLLSAFVAAPHEIPTASELSRRFGLSRSQVNRVIKTCLQAAHFERISGQRVAAGHRCVSDTQIGIARFFDTVIEAAHGSSTETLLTVPNASTAGSSASRPSA